MTASRNQPTHSHTPHGQNNTEDNQNLVSIVSPLTETNDNNNRPANSTNINSNPLLSAPIYHLRSSEIPNATETNNTAAHSAPLSQPIYHTQDIPNQPSVPSDDQVSHSIVATKCAHCDEVISTHVVCCPQCEKNGHITVLHRRCRIAHLSLHESMETTTREQATSEEELNIVAEEKFTENKHRRAEVMMPGEHVAHREIASHSTSVSPDRRMNKMPQEDTRNPCVNLLCDARGPHVIDYSEHVSARTTSSAKATKYTPPKLLDNNIESHEGRGARCAEIRRRTESILS